MSKEDSVVDSSRRRRLDSLFQSLGSHVTYNENHTTVLSTTVGAMASSERVAVNPDHLNGDDGSVQPGNSVDAQGDRLGK